MDKKIKMYIQIKQLHDVEQKSQRYIAEYLGISRNTVAKYLSMDIEEVTTYLASTKQRSQKLDEFLEIILGWLRNNPDMSASQIHDWLEERGMLGIAPSTLRRYVKELREDYHIPKVKKVRHYEAIPDPPMGEQAQIDFGQFTVKTPQGKKLKLYVIAFVLSNSRYKYMEWWDHPYTASDVIQAHENAFKYFGGRPKTIVYDQDRALFVDENYGDIIFTAEFEAYRQTQRFQVHACRGYDPESKGRIENVIGFIKKNFAQNCDFIDLESWNYEALAWLERKGNGKVHNTTKKVPAVVFKEERKHLQPVQQVYGVSPQRNPKMERKVHKDNIIHYNGNRYSLPRGTFGTIEYVYLVPKDGELTILKLESDEILAKHQIWKGNGQLIKDRNHSRDHSLKIEQLITEAIETFTSTVQAQAYFLALYQKYPRYTRDQVHLIMDLWATTPPELMNEALNMCMERKLFSATEFREVVSYLETPKRKNEPIQYTKDIMTPVISEKTKQRIARIKTEIRDLNDFSEVFGDVKSCQKQ